MRISYLIHFSVPYAIQMKTYLFTSGLNLFPTFTKFGLNFPRSQIHFTLLLSDMEKYVQATSTATESFQTKSRLL